MAAAAAAAVPDPLYGVRDVLQVCGFSAAIRTRFIDANGITSIADFGFMQADETKDIVKMYNQSQSRQQHRLGYIDQAKFTAFLWWYHDLKRHQETPLAADFTAATLEQASKDKRSEAELEKADKVDVKVPKLDVDMGWFD